MRDVRPTSRVSLLRPPSWSRAARPLGVIVLVISAVVLVVGSPRGAGADNASRLGPTWTQVARAPTDPPVVSAGRSLPNIGPSTRADVAMAYDPVRGSVLLFGGVNPLFQGDTWSWKNSAWTPHLVSDTGPAPSPRSGAAMAWDGYQMVLFGGLTEKGAVGDTWTWDGSRWNPLTLETAPSARYHASMVFDAKQDKVVLFGGAPANSNDTWLWDGSPKSPGAGPGNPKGWTSLDAGGPSGPSRPSGRSYAAMAYDGAGQNLVLFGGVDGVSSPLLDAKTWLWDNGWTAAPQPPSRPTSCPTPGAPVQTPAAPTLTPRYGAAMAFDEVTQKVVMFGGWGPCEVGKTLSGDFTSSVYYVDETWTWNGRTWELQDPFLMTPSPPPRRYGAAMAPNPGSRTVMLFGGHGSGSSPDDAYFGDTWTWDGTTPSTANPTPPPPPSTPLSPPAQGPPPVPGAPTPNPPAAPTVPAPSPLASPPLVHHVVPPSGSTTGGDTRVIDGSGFTTGPVTAVSFGGNAAASFSVIDDAHIRAVTPAHGAGTVDVTVTTSAGATSPVVRPQNSAVDDDEYTFFPPSPFAPVPNAGVGTGTFNQNQPARPVPPGGLGAVPAPGGGFAPGAAAGFLSPAGAPPPALAAGAPPEASQTPGAAVHHNMTRAGDEGGPGGAWAGIGAGGLLLLCSCFGRRRPSDPDVGYARVRGGAQSQRA